GMTPTQFEKVLQDYLHHALYFPMPAPPGIENTSTYPTKAIGETDAEAVLADLHMHEADYREVAVKEFEEVLAKQPDNAIAHRGLGYAFLQKAEFQKSEEHFRKAVEFNTTDAQAHYFYALLMVRRSGMVVAGNENQQYFSIGSGDASAMSTVKKEV